MKRLNYNVYMLGGGKSNNADNNNIYIEGEIWDGKIKTITKIDVDNSTALEKPDVNDDVMDVINGDRHIESRNNSGNTELIYVYDYNEVKDNIDDIKYYSPSLISGSTNVCNYMNLGLRVFVAFNAGLIIEHVPNIVGSQQSGTVRVEYLRRALIPVQEGGGLSNPIGISSMGGIKVTPEE
jgi:hypothetical protein